jgi:hypothetical protein
LPFAAGGLKTIRARRFPGITGEDGSVLIWER